MEITGRITADAKISKLTDGREVTGFTIVQNDYFKTKAGDKKQVATYFKCAYWLTSKTAPFLKKGTIVTLSGRVGMDVYSGAGGEPKGVLTVHVNDIKFIAKTGQLVSTAPQADNTQQTQTDDLPF